MASPWAKLSVACRYDAKVTNRLERYARSVTNPNPAPPTEGECEHMREVEARVIPADAVCAQCIAIGSTWFHLRMCLTCGQIACCDHSPMKHATAHFHETSHPVIRSAEPGEEWRWCYVDELMVWTGGNP